MTRGKSSDFADGKNTKERGPKEAALWNTSANISVPFTKIMLAHEESKIYKKSEAREKLDPMLLGNIALRWGQMTR